MRMRSVYEDFDTVFDAGESPCTMCSDLAPGRCTCPMLTVFPRREAMDAGTTPFT